MASAQGLASSQPQSYRALSPGGSYFGSTVSNTTYRRLVTTQAAGYRGVFSSDSGLDGNTSEAH